MVKMGKDISRAIKLVDKLKGQEWIQRTDLFSIFIDEIGLTETKFNSIVFLLKAKKIFSEYNRNQGYHVDYENFEKFKKKFKN